MAKRFELAEKYTQKYRDVLEPCPYCGSPVEIVSGRTIFNPHNIWEPTCPKCGDCVYGDTSVKQAVIHWNEHAVRIKEELK